MKNNMILEYTDNLLVEHEMELFFEQLIEEDLNVEFGVYLENITLDDMREYCEDILEENIKELNLVGEVLQVTPGAKSTWKVLPPKVKTILKHLGVIAGSGIGGSTVASLINPGSVHISGGLAAKFGTIIGGIIPILGYFGVKCRRHLWNFIRCAGRVFTGHQDAAGSTVQKWTNR